jgi:hypothetical protein
MIGDMLVGNQQTESSKLMLQDYKKFKHGKEVPQEAEIQYLERTDLRILDMLNTR